MTKPNFRKTKSSDLQGPLAFYGEKVIEKEMNRGARKDWADIDEHIVHVDNRREKLKVGLSSDINTFDPTAFPYLKADLIKNFEAYDMLNRALIFGSKRD